MGHWEVMAIQTSHPRSAPPPEAAAAVPAVRSSPVLARLAGGPPRRHLIAGYLVAILGNVAMTIALLAVRGEITPLSKGFGFLTVVVVAAAAGGLWPGLVASVVAFLTFNFFFLPPYGTFIIGRGEYVVVLFVFLGLSLLISALLARATERAETAETREEEIRALQSLSADLLGVIPGPRNYGPTLAKVIGLFGFTAGALFVQDPVARELRERVTVGAPPGELSPHWNPALDERAPERLPLSVGGRNLGLLVLRGERAPLAPAESRVLRAFCDELALVLERDRLLQVATEAEVYRQSDQVRRSLLAAVSHDLRTPLAAIKTSVTDLLDEEADRSGQDVRDALGSIDQETDRLAALIANLLDMSRIEGGILQARIQGVDLTEIVTGAVDRASRQWPGLQVRIAQASGADAVQADPVFLDRVVTNLLDNATKAAREAGRLRIQVEIGTEGERVVTRIVDHGGGVPASVREQLFYPFYQVSQRHPRLGTGLGLPISKGFLSLMHGEIWVEDTPGGGATFAFSLPVAPRRRVKKGRVLVVDDEEQIRRAVSRALTSRDYLVQMASDGEEALDMAHTFDPDLVVLDLNLPKLDGLSVCRQLRATSAVPILVLSVREEEADKVAALDLGADDYLTKPFGIDELLARVRALLRRAGSQGTPPGVRFATDDLQIDLAERRVTRAGQEVRLTRTEWSLLEALAQHPGKLLTHRWLLERAWGPGYAEDLEVLRVFVSQLRRKLEPDPGRPRFIGTDPGIGYRWLLSPSGDDGPGSG